MATLKDIAEKCNVATSTVSRAFDPKSRISKKTRKEILDTAELMNYSPNIIARSLRTECTYTVGFIIPSIENYFYIEVIKHLEIILRKSGYRLIVSFINEGITNEKDSLMFLASSNIDVIIFSPRDRENEKFLKTLSKKTKILQIFTAIYDEYNSIIFNDYMGMKKATQHLIEQGHRNIFVLCGDDRVQGYIDTCSENGIEVNETLCKKYRYNKEEIIEILKPHAEITAILSVAVQSETVIIALREIGKIFPQDISLIAYDDMNYCKMMGISSVAHNLDEALNAVSDKLKDFLDNKENKLQHLVLEPYLNLRESIKNINP